MGKIFTAKATIPRQVAAPIPARAWRIALIYAGFAMLWIYFSDHALHLLVPDPDARTVWSVYKGLVFVAVTSVMLLLLMRQAFGAIEVGYVSLAATEKERQAHEREVERVSRLYAALSHVNQAIVRSETRDGLFDEVCKALVEHGGFRMAWIGWHDPRDGGGDPGREVGNGGLASAGRSGWRRRPFGDGFQRRPGPCL